MNTLGDINNRTDARARIESDAITVRVEQIGANSGAVSAELVDMSSRGLRFVTSLPLSYGAIVQIHLECGPVDWQTVVTGTVRWTGATADRRWKVGCELLQEFCPTILTKLAVEGVIDRRRQQRRQSSFPTDFRRIGSPEPRSAHVFNISQTGACLATNELEHADDRLLITLQDENDECVQLPAVVQWTSRGDRGYLMGCRFLVEPAKLMLPKATNAASRPKRRRRVSLENAVGVVVWVGECVTEGARTLLSSWSSRIRGERNCQPSSRSEPADDANWQEIGIVLTGETNDEPAGPTPETQENTANTFDPFVGDVMSLLQNAKLCHANGARRHPQF